LLAEVGEVGADAGAAFGDVGARLVERQRQIAQFAGEGVGGVGFVAAG
jgi:hypothetical protein